MRCWFAGALVGLLGACSYHPDFAGTHYRCDDGVCPTGFSCVAGYCETGGDGGVGMDADASMLSWWDPAFTKRARITITNAAATGIPAGFQMGVRVTLATLDAPGAVWDDVRVVRYDAGTWTEKNRYEEGTTGTRTLWWKMDSGLSAGASNVEYWLYFGNPSPSAAPKLGDTVFDFYDAFEGTAVTAASWAIQGTPAPSAGELILKPGDSIRTQAQIAPDHAMAVSLTAPPNLPRFWIGFQRQTDFTDGDPWIIWINRSATDGNAPPGTSSATIYPETLINALSPTADFGNAIETLDSKKHYYTVQRMTDRIVFKYEEQVVYQYALPSAYTPNLQIRLANESSTSGTNISIGMVHVRQAVWPDPTVTIGPTESH